MHRHSLIIGYQLVERIAFDRHVTVLACKQEKSFGVRTFWTRITQLLMTLTLSSHQVRLLADAHFLDRLREMLLAGASAPFATRAELQGPEATLALRGQVERANRYGLRSELDVARYVATAWLLGSDFDRTFPAMAEVLASHELAPADKAEALESISVTLLETLKVEESP